MPTLHVVKVLAVQLSTLYEFSATLSTFHYVMVKNVTSIFEVQLIGVPDLNVQNVFPIYQMRISIPSMVIIIILNNLYTFNGGGKLFAVDINKPTLKRFVNVSNIIDCRKI